MKDRATYSPEELARYGLPQRGPTEPFAKWARIVRSAGKRVCDYTTSSDRWAANDKWWTGWVATGSGHTYTETDVDFYIPTIPSSPIPPDSAVYSMWIGLGGNSGGTLAQGGVVGKQTSSGVITYRVFYENTSATDPRAQYPTLSIRPGDHLYIKLLDGSQNCMIYIENLTTGQNTGNLDTWPQSDGLSAEGIMEWSLADGTYLAKFSPATFYGMGFTDNGAYVGFPTPTRWHGEPAISYNQYNCYKNLNIDPSKCSTWGPQLASVGSVQDDPGDVPYDQYTINWVAWGDGLQN